MVFACGYSKEFKDKANQLIRESITLNDNIETSNFISVNRFFNDAYVTFE